MEIFFRSIKVNKEKLDGFTAGEYLAIETDSPKSKEILIRRDEFETLYLMGKKDKRVTGAFPLEPQIAYGPDLLQLPQEESWGFKYKDLMKLLADKVDISSLLKAKVEEDLIIRSDLGMVLELPWEDIVNSSICVYRVVIGQENEGFEEKSENNLMLFMSHAYKGVGKNLKEAMDDEIRNIYGSLGDIMGENNQYFRMESIFLLKHTTRRSFEEIPWKRFNFVHFIMHGDQDGNLHFEKDDPARYKESDFIKIEDILNIMKGHRFKLVFLSVCYSGGSLYDGDSLAFQIIKCGYSKYVIGYAQPAGEDSAKDFSNFFYKNLMNGEKINDVYKKSIKSYYSGKSRIYKPLLYVHSNFNI